MKADIRKVLILVDEIHQEMGRSISPPTRRAAACAVIKNPFAGEYVEDLSPLMDIGAELGGYLGERAVEALGITPDKAESYGKAALVGEDGELEHAAALLHPKMGAPLRKWKRVQPLFRRPKSVAGLDKCSISRSGTRMQHTFVATSMAWRCRLMMRLDLGRSWLQLPLRTAVDRCPGLAD